MTGTQTRGRERNGRAFLAFAILTRYRSLEIQLAEAALMHVASREGMDTVFTLDRRNFGILRRAGGKKFRLIP